MRVNLPSYQLVLSLYWKAVSHLCHSNWLANGEDRQQDEVAWEVPEQIKSHLWYNSHTHVMATIDLFFHTHTLSGLTQAMAMMTARLMNVQTPRTTQNKVMSWPRNIDLNLTLPDWPFNWILNFLLTGYHGSCGREGRIQKLPEAEMYIDVLLLWTHSKHKTHVCFFHLNRDDGVDLLDEPPPDNLVAKGHLSLPTSSL